RPQNPVQDALVELINSKTRPSLEGRSLDQLLGLARATDWLTGAAKNLPSRDELLARIERERLLKPFRRLLSRGFLGRADTLAELHAFLLSEEATSSILFLHGPGGVGKSTLLARFITEVASLETVGTKREKPPCPFVYLDMDRVVLDPKDPLSL